MPSASRYLVKDSPKPLRDAVVGGDDDNGGGIKGRHYNSKLATQTNGLSAEEILYGLEMACLSISDDKPDTLKNVGVMNPWQIESMKIITGSKEKAFQPLSEILKEKYDLDVDKHLDVSGLSPGGHALDTQGFIAHNSDTIVLSYRCTTSASDWITNLTTTSSAWEIEEDVAQGHSGTWSAFSDLTNFDKLRAHTGFYNNFLVTVNDIREHIDPLLANNDDQPSRTLYVVGHSLGAGIAIMAACYFILDEQNVYNWKDSKHKLRVITAGGPRACCKSLQKAVDSKIKLLRKESPGQVLLARVVRDKDGVPTVPPTLLGFEHLNEKLVYICKSNKFGINTVLINPNNNKIVPKSILKSIKTKFPDLFRRRKEGEDDDGDDDDDSDDDEDGSNDVNVVAKNMKSVEYKIDEDDEDELAAKEKYDNMINMIPRSLRDHMPEFYLKPFMNLVLNGTVNMTDYDIDGTDDDYGDRGDVVEYYGGSGGKEFSHGGNVGEGGIKIDGITIYADKDVVHGIKVKYSDSEIEHDNGSHDGSSKHLKLDKDEYVVSVKLRLKRIKQKRNIVYLEFDTNHGNKISHGNDKGEEVMLKPKNENEDVLTGFKGRAGKRIDALAFIWGSKP